MDSLIDHSGFKSSQLSTAGSLLLPLPLSLEDLLMKALRFRFKGFSSTRSNSVLMYEGLLAAEMEFKDCINSRRKPCEHGRDCNN